MFEKVAIYTRLSKEDADKLHKGDDSESIQNQKLLLYDYAARNQWTVYDVYSDDDRSGLDRNRPEFNRMLTDAEHGKFSIIICKSQSRFTRDMELSEKYLHGEFVKWGIRFIGVVDNVDTDAEGNKKTRQISGLVNEWYSEEISRNVKAALNAKKKNGKFVSGWCPYGYSRDAADKNRLVINEETAPTVKRIFELYLQGYGSSSIATILTRDKIPTPTAYRRSKGEKYFNPACDGYSDKYGVWAINSVRRILRDETYVGHLVQGKGRTQSFKDRKVISVPQDEWIVVENTHEPIIDREAFLKAQELRNIKSASYSTSVIDKPTAHIFAGKVKCADCGSTMQKRHGKRGILYLKCGLALKTKQHACTLHTIRLNSIESEIESKIRELISVYLSSEANRDELLKVCNADGALKSELKKAETDLKATQKKLAETESTLKALYLDKVKGLITEANFLILQKELDSDTNYLSETQRVLIKKTEELRVRLETQNGFIEKIEDYIGFEKLTFGIVGDFIDYIEVGNNEVTVHWLL